MKVFSKIIVLSIIGLFIGACIVPNVISDTTSLQNKWYVDGDNIEGPWDGTQEYPYQYIQDAINVSDNGDIIEVQPGTYYENVFVNKSVTIIGENKETTIIDGNNLGDVVNVSANWVNISGFKIQNSGDKLVDAGIHIRSNYNVISDNNLGPNEMFGICITGSCNNIIEENYITSNVDGIHLSGSDNNKIIGNTIKKNDWDGICITDYTFYTDIFNNHLEANRRGVHINFYSHDNNVSSKNVILDNRFGVLVEGYSYENNIVNNSIAGSTKCGIKLDKGRNHVISENHIENCAISINLDFSPKNTITKNNLMAFEVGHIKLNARFVNSFGNRWRGNFWSDYPSSTPPKLILGTWYVVMLIQIPYFNFDWDPQLSPYNYS